MPDQIPIDPGAEVGAEAHEGVHEVLPDVGYQRLAIVNVAYVGAAGASDGAWVLVDAGVTGMTGRILHGVEHRYGRGARPAAIVMTHGHFDHVGALRELAERWDVPIYAHELELPYLDGRAAYPPPDPSVGGGMMARLSSLYPRGPVDVRPWLRTLPADGAVPGMPGWRWLHTPGHAPGHVALWRAADRTLLAGDAVITTKQESAYAVLTQKPELHGPPMYFTPDWPSARTSVERLAGLEPEILVSGHGRAMHGAAMRAALHALARDFDRVAIPEHGRYVPDRAPAGEREAP
ncbi:MAG TPA: MBL fold metallo-hydrolase [Gemmatimonadaceae bacterium]|nr:MBL fold metallo-hydrolase [Gemmatimonadaceae bacterium]